MNLRLVVPIESPIRREINAALLTLREDGSYAQV